jgi:hypothetical protein
MGIQSGGFQRIVSPRMIMIMMMMRSVMGMGLRGVLMGVGRV